MRTKTKIVATFASVVLSLPLLAQNGNNGAPNGNSLPNQLPQNSQDQNRQNGTGYGQNGNDNGNRQNDNNGNGNNGYGNRNGAILPAGTSINVRLDRSGNNDGDRQGGLVPATLVDDISVNGRVIASAGTRVQTRRSSDSDNSSSLRLDSMQLNGVNYRLNSNSVRSNGNGNDRDRDNYNNGNGSNDQNRSNNANESGLQRLGDLVGQGNNQGNNRSNDRDQQGNNRDRQSGGSVYHFRLTSASRPSGTNSGNNR